MAAWGVFAGALVVPLLWAWQAIGEFNAANPGPGCGMPILAIYSLALIGILLLSLLAGVLASLAFAGTARPRSWWRRAELALLWTPAALTGALLAAFFFV